jgi:hypothetical protein
MIAGASRMFEKAKSRVKSEEPCCGVSSLLQIQVE